MTIALNGLFRCRLLTFTRWSCSIWAIFAALTVPTLPSPARVVPAGEDTSTTKLAGVWSFDGRSGCKSGMAWVLNRNGSYSEIRLPDQTPLGGGKWYERGDTIYYSLPRVLTAAAGRPDKRMVIIERGPRRLVAVTNRRVRHVMHKCPG
ncbi:hypothetical protein [Sphingobium yanoikuyae]|jgi:hypothetical protein|uniref:DUF2147 domain-containing protein n=1 Tax=Sphingobium yanoikuyae TaxID=13690 RepID=A0A6P1GDJ9_SPHYA|nr:hypothetical protein [Sphingobium yanoikuyae]NBB40779.1 hypothetical protein [Sphingobium yanoikuyae]QHD66596.1 hypothetical protein GS397_05625 [Sphingobium yanoikuyae]